MGDPLNRHALRLSLALLLLVLAGCGPGLIETRLDGPEPIPEGRGVVAVQVVSNTRALAPMLSNWTAVSVVDLDDREKRYRLTPRETGLLGSRVFVGALPPGQYAIYNLHSFVDVNNAQYWLNAPTPRSLGSFDVLENRLSNLGSLAYQPLGEIENEKGQKRGLYVVTRIEEPQELSDFVKEAYPDFASRLTADFELGWRDDMPDMDRERIARRIRDVGFGNRVLRLEDGTVVMAGKLGRVYWRTGDDQWRQSDTGYTNEIGAVSRTREGYAIAGERGLALVAPNLEGPWQQRTGPGTQWAVTWMHTLPGGELIAIAKGPGEDRIFRVSEDFERWQSLRSFKHNTSLYFSGYGQTLAVSTPSGRLAVFANGARLEYDPATDSFTEQASEPLFRLEQQPDGTLVSVSGHWWSGMGTARHSLDQGKTWNRFNRLREHEAGDSVNAGMAVRLDGPRELMVSRKYMKSAQSQRVRITRERFVRVSAGEAIQQWGEELDPQCADLLPQISSERQLFSLCEDGSVMRSDDLGQTWTKDRKVELKSSEVPEGMVGGTTET